jgi:hypothetical protein
LPSDIRSQGRSGIRVATGAAAWPQTYYIGCQIGYCCGVLLHFIALRCAAFSLLAVQNGLDHWCSNGVSVTSIERQGSFFMSDCSDRTSASLHTYKHASQDSFFSTRAGMNQWLKRHRMPHTCTCCHSFRCCLRVGCSQPVCTVSV